MNILLRSCQVIHGQSDIDSNVAVQGGLLNMAPFDPMGMDSDAMRLREVKNGRLAMLSFVGYVS